MTTICWTPCADQRGRRPLRGWAPEFQEGGLDDGVAAGAREFRGDRADGLIGRFDAGTVGEDDNPRGHALLMYARMWWISSVLRATS